MNDVFIIYCLCLFRFVYPSTYLQIYILPIFFLWIQICIPSPSSYIQHAGHASIMKNVNTHISCYFLYFLQAPLAWWSIGRYAIAESILGQLCAVVYWLLCFTFISRYMYSVYPQWFIFSFPTFYLSQLLSNPNFI